MSDAVHVSSKGIQVYTTPRDFVHLCAIRFGVKLAIDLAADEDNSRCDIFYNEKDNSLIQPWAEVMEPISAYHAPRHAAAWLNPPFKGTPKFMAKCAEESKKGAKIITLTLASLGTQWYKKHVKPNALSLILEDRITFEGQPAPFPKELMVSLWGFGMTGLGWWAWKREMP